MCSRAKAARRSIRCRGRAIARRASRAPADLRALLEAAGFHVVSWRDTTAEARLWLEEMKARMAEPNPPPSTLRLLFGEDAKPMVQNLARNLLEDRVAPTEVICAKP